LSSKPTSTTACSKGFQVEPGEQHLRRSAADLGARHGPAATAAFEQRARCQYVAGEEHGIEARVAGDQLVERFGALAQQPAVDEQRIRPVREEGLAISERSSAGEAPLWPRSMW
jgi:hypothetical protein